MGLGVRAEDKVSFRQHSVFKHGPRQCHQTVEVKDNDPKGVPGINPRPQQQKNTSNPVGLQKRKRGWSPPHQGWHPGLTAGFCGTNLPEPQFPHLEVQVKMPSLWECPGGPVVRT